MSRYALELKYDGTNYHGWQSQLNIISVQQVLQESLSKILRQSISVTGCGRTDTGVHAGHFVANFSFEKEISSDFLFRLNNLLPHDISVFSIYAVPENFNARFDALSRSYRYVIERVKNPFNKDHSYLFYRALNIDVMQKGCSIIKEHKEFGAFCKSHSQNKTNICEIMNVSWEEYETQLVFKIQANRFLRNMVRAIVGTLIELGESKITLEELNSIIESQDRQKAGYSVPARGLFLDNVQYNREDWKLIDKK